MNKIDIVFMGTPEFAVTILAKLLTDEAINIVGVITAPDKPAGRGRKMHSSAVKEIALEHNLKILQPTNLKDKLFVEELHALHADLFVVVAFRMLPEVVWSMPKLGTINLHASLLPQYRGAAPINWAIINGEQETGVTTFFIAKEIDTGAIIEQRKVEIGDNMTVGELYEELMVLGAEATHSTVQKIMHGDITRIDQASIAQNETLKSAPKIFKEDCAINFDNKMESVFNLCRGLDPYPGAWLRMKNTDKDEIKTMKIFRVEKTALAIKDELRIELSDGGILLPCSDFYLLVHEVQLEGKRKMNVKEFILGHNVTNFRLHK